MQILIIILASFLDTASMSLLFQAFFARKRPRLSQPLIFVVLFVVQLLSYVLPYVVSTPYENMNSLVLLAYAVLSCFFATYMYDSPMRHRIFVTLSWYAIASLGELLVYAMFPASHGESMVSVNGEPNYLWSFVSICISFFLILILCYIIRTHRDSYSIKYTSAVLLTPVLSILGIQMAVDYSSYRLHGIYVYQIGLVLCFYIINAVHYFLFHFVIRSNVLAAENQRLLQQVAFQTDKYQQISTAYKNTRGILHDTKKHFLYLGSCIDSGNYGAVQGYLPSAISKLEQSYNRINTGNLVVDAFVSNYLSIAENEGILFVTDIQIDPSRIPVGDYDLCIVLGNLLDNSLQAVRRILPPMKREIHVHLFHKNSNFVIHITNSITPDAAAPDARGSLDHGYGCRNVEQVTLKSNGVYSHWTEEGKYIAVVSFPSDDSDGK